MKKDMDFTKKKVSFDIKPENIQAIEDFKQEDSLDGSYTIKTTTEIINDCLSLLLDTSKEFKNNLAKIACTKMRNFNPKSIREQAMEGDIEKWGELYAFLTHNRGLYEKPKEFERHDFSDGYIIVPSDWIFLHPNSVNIEYCKYPTVIEFRNSRIYNIPHFFFISELEQIPDSMEKEYLQLACRQFPPLKEVMPLVTGPIMSNGEMLNEEIYVNAPEPGFFKFPKYGDRTSKSLLGELWVTKEKIELMEKYGKK